MNLLKEKIKEAGRKSGTDKIEYHGYDRFYSEFLNQNDIKNDILEIGYGEGKSIEFWNYIYPNSFLNIIDKNIEEKYKNYQVYKCDQSKKKDLISTYNLLKEKSIELIVDDGSHLPEHQIITFNIFFNDLLIPGCPYFIEDIETSYWKRGNTYGYPTNYGLNSKKSIINIFLLLINWINSEFLTDKEKNKLTNLIKLAGFDMNAVNKIKNIGFGKNIICITKKTEEDLIYEKKEYRFKQNIESQSDRFKRLFSLL